MAKQAYWSNGMKGCMQQASGADWSSLLHAALVSLSGARVKALFPRPPSQESLTGGKRGSKCLPLTPPSP